MIDAFTARRAAAGPIGSSRGLGYSRLGYSRLGYSRLGPGRIVGARWGQTRCSLSLSPPLSLFLSLSLALSLPPSLQMGRRDVRCAATGHITGSARDSWHGRPSGSGRRSAGPHAAGAPLTPYKRVCRRLGRTRAGRVEAVHAHIQAEGPANGIGRGGRPSRACARSSTQR